ncbi:hypothetical protein D7294_20600 [Streptomyces hoynatensis]|uniref:Uncharacterized protein n=1 Tax=Streptomyces hoynatensis TaxID=1141874 RepID=A0A3A9YUT9_9ACTN|nr:hypothetical protein D7294_20600 [Streptomyces hoynatensis]
MLAAMRASPRPAAPAAPAPFPQDACPFCGRPAPGGARQWSLRSWHATSGGRLEYCVSSGGCLVVLLDGELLKHVAGGPRAAGGRSGRP